MAATIIISVFLLLIVALIIRKIYRDKKSGISSCGSCSGCPHAGTCHGKKSSFDRS